ncbi:ArsR/SmtB family transcription factor [Cellulomonas fengjieae]|uniref:Helix-turn-helix transcriptional regulator n=1 Tax=Cellulomonas fengjieae TaxID=2819978 RepID=A0ABS3SK28_9CELL|nr:helix-turn-helix domain-containing protein [Cellulomonas fengjieae]MBO3086101.1 helix-turn-helix transcriptional regulator [Cellulomonas fengjieae]QVI65835.1 helix-turn-helix transcriptional regulator [Cellulomonas fengjieae]
MSPHEQTGRPAQSDPERMRALAHPLRLALLDYLDGVGEATATQCARHTGETVANCSFHLRLLARYGFIEPAEPRGRERPWRPTVRGEPFAPDESVPGSLVAVVELAEVAVRQEAEAFISFLHERAGAGADLAGRPLPTAMTKDAFWATPDETEALMRDIGALFEPYIARVTDAAARPAGALLMRWFATSRPDLHTDPAPGPEA